MDLDGIRCRRCEGFGHVARECSPEPARTLQEHEERIRRLGVRWTENEITHAEKTLWIEKEVDLWNRYLEELAAP